MDQNLETFVTESAAKIFQDSDIRITDEELQKVCEAMTLVMGDLFVDIAEAPSINGKRMEFSGLDEESGDPVFQLTQSCSQSS